MSVVSGCVCGFVSEWGAVLQMTGTCPSSMTIARGSTLPQADAGRRRRRRKDRDAGRCRLAADDRFPDAMDLC